MLASPANQFEEKPRDLKFDPLRLKPPRTFGGYLCRLAIPRGGLP